MACFLTPMAVGIVTTALRKKVPEKYHINWLNLMLWGGVVMLAVEHICHREISPYPPFLTADLSEVLSEILIVGVPMAASIVLLWGIMVIVTARMSERVKYVET